MAALSELRLVGGGDFCFFEVSNRVVVGAGRVVPKSSSRFFDIGDAVGVCSVFVIDHAVDVSKVYRSYRSLAQVEGTSRLLVVECPWTPVEGDELVVAAPQFVGERVKGCQLRVRDGSTVDVRRSRVVRMRTAPHGDPHLAFLPLWNASTYSSIDMVVERLLALLPGELVAAWRLGASPLIMKCSDGRVTFSLDMAAVFPMGPVADDDWVFVRIAAAFLNWRVVEM
jgi:hypothetical protein